MAANFPARLQTPYGPALKAYIDEQVAAAVQAALTADTKATDAATAAQEAQSGLTSKAEVQHGHTIDQVDGLQAALDAFTSAGVDPASWISVVYTDGQFYSYSEGVVGTDPLDINEIAQPGALLVAYNPEMNRADQLFIVGSTGIMPITVDLFSTSVEPGYEYQRVSMVYGTSLMPDPATMPNTIYVALPNPILPG